MQYLGNRGDGILGILKEQWGGCERVQIGVIAWGGLGHKGIKGGAQVETEGSACKVMRSAGDAIFGILEELQYSSDIPEPKYTRCTRTSKTSIRV